MQQHMGYILSIDSDNGANATVVKKIRASLKMSQTVLSILQADLLSSSASLYRSAFSFHVS